MFKYIQRKKYCLLGDASVRTEAYQNGTPENLGHQFHNSGSDVDIAEDLCEYPETLSARSRLILHLPD